MNVNKTKVYQLFASLSVGERKDFMRFLRTRSKPKRTKLKAGFHFLIAYEAAIGDGEKTNQDWWKAVFPEEPFDVGAIRKHQNNLIQNLEAFLVHQKLYKDHDTYMAKVREAEQQLLLLATLLERSLDSLFAMYAKKTMGLIESLPADHDRFALAFRLELLQIGYQQKNSPAKSQDGFPRSQIALDRYYTLHSLKLEVATRNQKTLSAKQQDLHRMDAIAALLAALPSHNLLAQMCAAILDLSEDSTFSQLENLYDQLVQASDEIAPESFKDLLYILLNFSIRRINEGKELFQLIALTIYLKLLEKGLLQKDSKAFKNNFLNIVRLAFNCEQHEQLSKFIVTQKEMLEQEGEFRNVLLFYEGQRLFSQKEYANACNCFWKVWMIDEGQKVRHSAGIFVLKSYYESNEIDQIKQFATDFKRSIAQQKSISATKKEAYKEFLNAIQFLCKIRFHGLTAKNKKRLQDLEEVVNESRLMNSRSWLLSKIAQLWKAEK